MKQKVYFVSLGCSRNLVDSEVMIAKLFEENLLLTNEVDKADIFIINTCGFLKEARNEAYLILDEIYQNKKNNSKIIITGCMANLFFKEVEKRYEIFSVLSSGNIDRIIEAINKPTIAIDKLSYLQKKDFSRIVSELNHLAYLKIAEGCSKACSFCIIPKIKGPLISRSQKSIIDEFNYLLSKGVFEINLIAQDLLDYGEDINEKNAFLKLINKILRIRKDFWLRLLYVYPDEITDEFIDLIASDSRICKYLDIPLQHVSDKILVKMNRKTSKKKIYILFEKLQKKIPGISLRVSFMVGFPTETDKDFNELLDFVETFSIDHLAVFKYSNEKHSASYKFDGQIPKKIKQNRFDVLTKKQLDFVQQKNKKLIGKTLIAMIDEYHPQSNILANARHQGQTYKVDSNIIINDVEKVLSFGTLHKVKVTDIAGYDLVGFPLKI
jgi:ribosomal protein S12 methylthiotransferase